MIKDHDEYLHEFKKNTRWIERYSVNFIDKKNKIFGFADLNYLFQSKKIEYNWTVFLNDAFYAYQKITDYNGTTGQKLFSSRNFKYQVRVPKESIEVELRNDYLSCVLTMSGSYPIYRFPTSMTDETEGVMSKQLELWDRYEQRCRTSGRISITKGEKKGIAKKFDCIGFRKHSWGERYPEDMSCYSWITVQFRDMTIDLTYMEIDNVPYSGGFISRKSGNIPVMNVEQELFSLSRDRKSLLSTEFSYRDAQDDRDLIVSKKIHSMEMTLPKSRKNRYIRIRSFSDFMVIGTGKKGIGMEEHYISLDKLDKMA